MCGLPIFFKQSLARDQKNLLEIGEFEIGKESENASQEPGLLSKKSRGFTIVQDKFYPFLYKMLLPEFAWNSAHNISVTKPG